MSDLDFTPTGEQTSIVSAATDTQDNLLISALAGAAKTSTLVLIAQALPKTSMLCLAFNKRIADEMKSRLPRNCESRTLNSLGHSAWASYLGIRLTLDTKKTYRLVGAIIDSMPPDQRPYKSYSLIMNAVDFGKSCGYIPDDFHAGGRHKPKPLIGDDEFYSELEEEPTDAEWEVIVQATAASLRESLAGTIDFSDQLLMPTVFGAVFPFFPLVMVDEAQDLSALNHAMLRKLAKKRLIAVGDACQSIYGFRGAHENSMALLQQEFHMTELGLTISFRCPIAVVEEARWRAPHMRYPEWAKPGEVTHLAMWDINSIPTSGCAIICRNNAPLFSMAIRMLRDGRYPELVGNDIGKSLIKQMKGFGDESMLQADALEAVNKWVKDKLRKSRNPARIHDQADCLRVFIEAGPRLSDAIHYAERIMSVTGPTKLMTGHKSKGLEFEHVIFLDQELVRDNDQDKNLRYVIQTRSKSTLTYAESKKYYSDKEPLDD